MVKTGKVNLSASFLLSALSQNCIETFQITGTVSVPNTLNVPLGTVCIECIIDGAVATDATFTILNTPVPSDQGVYMVDTDATFDAATITILRCNSGGQLRQASVLLEGMSFTLSVTVLAKYISYSFSTSNNHWRDYSQRGRYTESHL